MGKGSGSPPEVASPAVGSPERSRLSAWLSRLPEASPWENAWRMVGGEDLHPRGRGEGAIQQAEVGNRRSQVRHFSPHEFRFRRRLHTVTIVGLGPPFRAARRGRERQANSLHVRRLAGFALFVAEDVAENQSEHRQGRILDEQLEHFQDMRVPLALELLVRCHRLHVDRSCV